MQASNQRPGRTGAVILALGPFLIGLGCIVTPPEPSEVWESWQKGLISPRDTFDSFVVSLRGEILAAEYRCFSSGWKSRNGISQIGYREFRDQLINQQPHLIWALSRAETEVDPGPGPHQATVWATIPGMDEGQRIAFHMVQEAYMEVRTIGRRMVSEPIPRVASHLRHDQDQSLLFAWIPLDENPALDDVSSFRLETEWLIDRIEFPYTD